MLATQHLVYGYWMLRRMGEVTDPAFSKVVCILSKFLHRSNAVLGLACDQAVVRCMAPCDDWPRLGAPGFGA